MIISNQYRYVFIELPRTASSVISKELVSNYCGKNILNKHATYRDLKKYYPKEAEEYFIFSCIRNPMDKTVSIYFKLLSYYQNPETFNRRGRRIMNFYMKKRKEFVIKNNASFKSFFLRYYSKPYDDWASLDHHSFNYLIRYERLQDDFSSVIKKLGLTPVRYLPIVNKTQGKEKNFEEFFNDNELRKRAQKVFSCYMKRFGYQFPASWKLANVNNCYYWKFLALFRKIFWKYWSAYRVWYHLKKNQ